MTDPALPPDVDPFIAERVVAIRDRFGMRGLRATRDLVDLEIAIFEDAARAAEETEDTPTR